MDAFKGSFWFPFFAAQTPHAGPFSDSGPRPETLYTAAAERFLETLRDLSGAGGWSQLSTSLAKQFEQWLRLSQSAIPTFGGTAASSTYGAAQGWQLGPLPLGPAAVPSEAQRLWARLAQLQGELAVHWSKIAQSAAQRFVARGDVPKDGLTLDETLKLYDRWVSCAEQAYTETAHSEAFSQLQGELANVSAALLVERRRQMETLAGTLALPTRSELDAIYKQIRDLSDRIAQLEPAAAKRATKPPRTHPRKKAARGTRRRSRRP